MTFKIKRPNSEKGPSSPASDQFILPKPKPDIHPLSKAELQRLESALGKPIERQVLAYWVSQATRDIARLSILPTPQQLNTDLRRMARDGRRWLREASESTAIFSPAQRAALDRLVEAADPFFDNINVLGRTGSSREQGWPPAYAFRVTGFPRQDDWDCEAGKGPAEYSDARHSNQEGPSSVLSVRSQVPSHIEGPTKVITIAVSPEGRRAFDFANQEQRSSN